MAPDTLRLDHPLLRLRDLRQRSTEREATNAERPPPGPGLASAAQHFVDLYDLAPVGYLTVDEAGLIQSANRAAERLLGSPKHEIMQQPFCGFVLPKDRAIFQRHHHQALTTSTYPRSELRLLRANAESCWARLDATVHRSAEHHSPVCLLAISDITEHKRAEQELLESRELLALFIRHSPIYAYIKEVTPTQSRVLHACDRFQELIGTPCRDLEGKTMSVLFPTEVAAKMTAHDWQVVASGQVMELDETLHGRQYATIKFPIPQGDKTLLAGYTIDVTERHRFEAALQQQAHTDELTGATNRRHFLELAQLEIGRARRLQRPLALVLIDIDRLKDINDAYGHAVGDRALLVLAEVCRSNIREIDVFARFGGDEFTLLLPEAHCQQALDAMHRVCRALHARPVELDGQPAAMTVKVAPGARSSSPSPMGGGQGGGTAQAPAPFILRGGAGAMAVTLSHPRPGCYRVDLSWAGGAPARPHHRGDADEKQTTGCSGADGERPPRRGQPGRGGAPGPGGGRRRGGSGGPARELRPDGQAPGGPGCAGGGGRHRATPILSRPGRAGAAGVAGGRHHPAGDVRPRPGAGRLLGL